MKVRKFFFLLEQVSRFFPVNNFSYKYKKLKLLCFGFFLAFRLLPTWPRGKAVAFALSGSSPERTFFLSINEMKVFRVTFEFSDFCMSACVLSAYYHVNSLSRAVSNFHSSGSCYRFTREICKFTRPVFVTFLCFFLL